MRVRVRVRVRVLGPGTEEQAGRRAAVALLRRVELEGLGAHLGRRRRPHLSRGRESGLKGGLQAPGARCREGPGSG